LDVTTIPILINKTKQNKKREGEKRREDAQKCQILNHGGQ
jgi:hypothetical protein